MNPFDRLVEMMARLRAPDGCPWDRAQTHESIRRYVIEEAYEVAEAIDRGEPRELRAELGDLLLQVLFHSQIASEEGRFDVEAVCRDLAEKLERRHPHVFGSARADTAEEVGRAWERIKATERGPGGSALDGVPRTLPALQRAERLGEKAARAGLDWKTPEAVLEKIDEERSELGEALASGDRRQAERELGDLLFAAASLARKLDIEPERALASALDRFGARFRHLEATARRRGETLGDLDPDELDRRWAAAKGAVDRAEGDR